MLTPEQETVLQSFLMRKTTEWQQYIKEYPELLERASFHIAPDGAWIAVEHEEQQGAEEGYSNRIIRKSPACSQLITKI